MHSRYGTTSPMKMVPPQAARVRLLAAAVCVALVIAAIPHAQPPVTDTTFWESSDDSVRDALPAPVALAAPRSAGAASLLNEQSAAHACDLVPHVPAGVVSLPIRPSCVAFRRLRLPAIKTWRGPPHSRV